MTADIVRLENSGGIPRDATNLHTDLLRLHAEADVVPPMTPDEFDAFQTDVEQRGITTPLTVTPFGIVLDGRHRLTVARALGIAVVPVHVAPIAAADQVEYMVRQALLRRHLSLSQRRDMAASLLRDNPAKSDRQIAGIVGLSNKTVGAVRDDLTSGEEIPHLTERAGADGKVYSLPSRWNPGAGLMTSESPEWYTPRRVVSAVVTALGQIDLDPCAETARGIPAAAHLTEADDGLTREWAGRVYMNPPYGRGIGDWTTKLRAEHDAGRVSEAVALVPARTETDWWASIDAEYVCFIHGRLAFSDADTAAPFPSAALYLGADGQRFAEAFASLGPTYRRVTT